MENKQELHELFMKLLEEYEEAESMCINEFSGEIQREQQELKNKIKDYEGKLKELLRYE